MRSSISLWFWFVLLKWLITLSIFLCTFWLFVCIYIYIFFEGMLIQIFYPFLIGWVIIVLCISWVTHLWDICFAIFFPIPWIAFSISWWCPSKHKFLILMRFSLPIFFLLLMLLVLHLRNLHLIQDHEDLHLFLFLGPHLRHLEKSSLRVQSELQLPAYPTATATPDLSQVCDLHHSSW